jgi:hypothetical protein
MAMPQKVDLSAERICSDATAVYHQRRRSLPGPGAEIDGRVGALLMCIGGGFHHIADATG